MHDRGERVIKCVLVWNVACLLSDPVVTIPVQLTSKQDSLYFA
jgi:hypothetical protein